MWHLLACYVFIKIKLASYHLLLYIVYICQKSCNSINAFVCYKQKCKLARFNLAHPVFKVHWKLQREAYCAERNQKKMQKKANSN